MSKKINFKLLGFYDCQVRYNLKLKMYFRILMVIVILYKSLNYKLVFSIIIASNKPNLLNQK